MDWQHEMNKNRMRGHKIHSMVKYGIVNMTPDSMKCKLYCNGAKCKYCTINSWKANEQAINGLYSHWITDDIIAMARPVMKTITEHDFIQQLKNIWNNHIPTMFEIFKESIVIVMGIRSVINMQTPGEHAFCGPPLEKSGFTYNPELLMQNKRQLSVYYYNFAWPDFGTSTIQNLLDLAKVIHFSLTQGKLAIHCHAGLGRTGAAIASYLIWWKNYSPQNAISFIRSKRPNSVQSTVQIGAIESLWDFLVDHARAIPEEGKMTFEDYLIIQKLLLPNNDVRRYEHIPKIVHKIFITLFSLTSEKHNSEEQKEYNENAEGSIHRRLCPKITPKNSDKLRDSGSTFLTYYADNLIDTKIEDDKEEELQKLLANGSLRMTALDNFSTIFKSQPEFAFYILHRFMISLVRPIISKENILEILSDNQFDFTEARQCFFQYTLDSLAILLGEEIAELSHIISVWFYDGYKNDELRTSIEKYLLEKDASVEGKI